MKYSIGYQLPDEYDSTYDLCRDYKDHISNVYFSWANEPGGRMPLCDDDKKSVEEISAFQLEELLRIRELGISLTLLFNANCYGEKASSRELSERLVSLARYLKEKLGISSVTTASPFVAKELKKAFGSSLSVTASVNMRVATVAAMDQLKEYFDGFYAAKEVNRSLRQLGVMKKWCDAKGKSLKILANSGCLSHCAFQTYHDNLVAHHKFMQTTDSDSRFPAPCWEYLYGLDEVEAFSRILGANWIRPEDIHCYEAYFDEMKLATRMHSSPRRVVSAYARGRFSGNLTDLFEPSYSPLFHGTVLDNRAFPDDWQKMTDDCGKDCENCGYCKKVAEKIKCKYN